MIEAVLVLGIIGFIAGSGLAFASKYFYVVKDERIEVVKDMLSGANCGACGYAGCAALAKAICEGTAPVSLCAALKENEIKNINRWRNAMRHNHHRRPRRHQMRRIEQQHDV